MSKTIRLEPIGTESTVDTNTQLLSGLLQQEINILQACAGRGLCATCHVFIKDGIDGLSPITKKEQRTLGLITTCNETSRLACQARVVGDGIVVQLPSGTYINEVDNVDDLVGRRAQADILHPITGQVLVEESKLITRSMISQLNDTKIKVDQYLEETQEA